MMSMTLYVVSCDMFLVYKIFINPHITFFLENMICVCCVIVQLYISVHMYFLVAVIFDSYMYCTTVICSIFLYFNNELSSTIM